MQIPPPSENSEEKQTEMFQFVEKLMVEEIEADLNDHSEWLKIGSVFKIHYLVYHNYVKPGLHISEAIKTAPPPFQNFETDCTGPDLLNDHIKRAPSSSRRIRFLTLYMTETAYKGKREYRKDLWKDFSSCFEIVGSGLGNVFSQKPKSRYDSSFENLSNNKQETPGNCGFGHIY